MAYAVGFPPSYRPASLNHCLTTACHSTLFDPPALVAGNVVVVLRNSMVKASKAPEAQRNGRRTFASLKRLQTRKQTALLARAGQRTEGGSASLAMDLVHSPCPTLIHARSGLQNAQIPTSGQLCQH